MCGIVGYVGHRQALPILVEGLAQLEYRGYDSAGVALHRDKQVDVIKTCGRINQLREQLPKRSSAKTGIGHTRWATHGAPNDVNAHPHQDASGSITLVHNGIVENAEALRGYLMEKGVTFHSDTDSEVLAALIADNFDGDLQDAVRQALQRVVGTYGIAVMHADNAHEIVAARNGSPVIVGIGDNEMFVASDASALAAHTQRVVYLDDGDVARVTHKVYEVQDLHAQHSERPSVEIDIEATLADRGSHEHFTLKEIYEQPEALERLLSGRLDSRFKTSLFGGLNLAPRELLGFDRIKLLGCGSALISASIGAGFIEQLARIPADAESAAEFRYRNPIIEPNTLYFAVSQSGETYDTLAAVQEIQRKGGTVLGVINVVGSSIARACGAGMYLHAGPEVAVVSTKTFMNTLAALALFALHLGRMRDLSPAEGQRLIEAFEALPQRLRELLSRHAEFKQIAEHYAQFQRAYFVGRGAGLGLAQEGSLKLKEISYIHAEAYPASELKHGPLALVDPNTPTFAVLPQDDLLAKNRSTIAEIKTRNGPVVAIGATAEVADLADHSIEIAPLHPILDPLLLLVPLQFIAYYSALARQCDVDKPRNLAKSVTVE